MLDRGGIAVELLKAAIAREPFPADVPDTPRNKLVWARILAELAELPPGTVPEIPFDHVDS